MGDMKPKGEAISPSEYYSVVGLAFLIPPLLVLAAAGFPDHPLRQAAFGCGPVAAVGLSITFNVMGMRHRSRTKRDRST
jgi:hypothetical protein